jgi:hypothetical protein
LRSRFSSLSVSHYYEVLLLVAKLNESQAKSEHGYGEE